MADFNLAKVNLNMYAGQDVLHDLVYVGRVGHIFSAVDEASASVSFVGISKMPTQSLKNYAEIHFGGYWW